MTVGRACPAQGVVCALIARAYASDARCSGQARGWSAWDASDSGCSPLIPLVYAISSPLSLGCAVELCRSIHLHAAHHPRLLLLRNWALGRFGCATVGFIMLVGLLIWLRSDPVFAPQARCSQPNLGDDEHPGPSP